MNLRRLLLTTALAAGFAAPAWAKSDLIVGIAAQDVGKLDPHLAVSTIDRTVVAVSYLPGYGEGSPCDAGDRVGAHLGLARVAEREDEPPELAIAEPTLSGRLAKLLAIRSRQVFDLTVENDALRARVLDLEGGR